MGRRNIGAAAGRRRFGTVRSRLALVVALLAVVGLASAVVVLVSLGRVTRANDDLTSELVPAQTDAAQLSRVYHDLAINLASGEASAESVAIAWQTGGELRNEIRPLVAADETLGTGFAQMEAAADSWVQIATPSSDRVEVRAALVGYAPLRDALDRLTGALDAAVSRRQRVAADAAQSARVAAAVAGLALLVAGCGVALLLRRWITRPIDQLVRQVRTVAAGNLGSPITPSGPDDLASVGRAVEAMRVRLLDDARHRVDSALIAGHQAESARIAGDLHDDQVQAMTLASIRLQQLRRRARDQPDLVELATTAEQATNQAIARLRRMIFELHSPVLDDEGLLAAIEVYADETFADSVAWSVHGDPGPLDGATAGLAYRLAREAMFNVYKHAAAGVLEVVVERQPSSLTVTVRDDGRGFDPSAMSSEHGHLGFDHSRQLAEAAGGTWVFATEPGRGTTVRFTLPIGRADAVDRNDVDVSSEEHVGGT